MARLQQVNGQAGAIAVGPPELPAEPWLRPAPTRAGPASRPPRAGGGPARPARALTGPRLLHPAARPCAPVPVSTLLEMAEGLAGCGRSVPADAGGPPGGPRWVRLLRTPAYDAWLLTWPPGATLPRHGHGGSAGVVQMAAGSLREVTTAADGSARVVRAIRHHHPSVTGPDQCHELRNVSGEEVTSVHLFSPPLETVGDVPVHAHAAEATAADDLRPGPGGAISPG